MNDSRVWLVTGSPEAGKTSFCRMAANLARTSNWDVAGLLSTATIEEGQKVGIVAEDLRTGDLQPLATTTPRQGFNLPQGRWYFSRAALEWGAKVIRTSLPCDLLIVDELGPLELKQGRGWAVGIQILKQPGFQRALAVIRPTLLYLARGQFPRSEVISLGAAQNLETALKSWWNQPRQSFL